MVHIDNIVGKVNRMDDNNDEGDFYSYPWTINNFCVYCPSESVKTSPKFRSKFDNKTTWALKLHDVGDWFDLFLLLKNNVENKAVDIDYEISILNKKKQKTHQQKSSCSLKKGRDIRKFARTTIPNKKLIILCEIKEICIFSGYVYGSDKLSADFQNCVENSTHADTRIVRKGQKTFDDHRTIRASRSSWYRTAFQSSILQDQGYEITICDFKLGNAGSIAIHL